MLRATAENVVIRDHLSPHKSWCTNWHISENAIKSNSSGAQGSSARCCPFASLSLYFLPFLSHAQLLSCPLYLPASPCFSYHKVWLTALGLLSLTIIPLFHHIAGSKCPTPTPHSSSWPAELPNFLTSPPLLVCLFISTPLHLTLGHSSISHFNFSCLFPYF